MTDNLAQALLRLAKDQDYDAAKAVADLLTRDAGEPQPGPPPRTAQPGDRVGPEDLRVGDVVRENCTAFWIETRLSSHERDGSWLGDVVRVEDSEFSVGERNRINYWEGVTLVSRAEDTETEPADARSSLARIALHPGLHFCWLAQSTEPAAQEMRRRMLPHIEAEARDMLGGE